MKPLLWIFYAHLALAVPIYVFGVVRILREKEQSAQYAVLITWFVMTMLTYIVGRMAGLR